MTVKGLDGEWDVVERDVPPVVLEVLAAKSFGSNNKHEQQNPIPSPSLENQTFIGSEVGVVAWVLLILLAVLLGRYLSGR
jgi:hypothetical protein